MTRPRKEPRRKHPQGYAADAIRAAALAHRLDTEGQHHRASLLRNDYRAVLHGICCGFKRRPA